MHGNWSAWDYKSSLEVGLHKIRYASESRWDLRGRGNLHPSEKSRHDPGVLAGRICFEYNLVCSPIMDQHMNDTAAAFPDTRMVLYLRYMEPEIKCVHEVQVV